MSEPYKTRNMTLATYLHICGFEYDVIKDGERSNGHPIGAWLFAPAAALPAAVSNFESGEAKVDPKKFHETLNRRREELFERLGMNK